MKWRHTTDSGDLIYVRTMPNQQFDRRSPLLLAAPTVRDAIEGIVSTSILRLNIRAELQEQTQTGDIPGKRGGADQIPAAIIGERKRWILLELLTQVCNREAIQQNEWIGESSGEPGQIRQELC